jgi:parvulin-like peptidyl-prolyl isomerase
MSRLIFASCLLLLVFSNVFADEPAKPADRPKALTDPIAKVNGVPITVKMLNQAFEERLPATGHRNLSEKRLAEIRWEELNKLIVREILHQEAKRLGIKADSKEVESEFSKIKARFPTEKKFKETMNQQGLTPSQVREGLVSHLMIQKLTENEVHSKITITDDELKAYYEGHREQFVMPEAVRLRQILIRVDPGGMEPDWDAARKKAQEISDRIRAGEDVASLAAQFSEDDETKAKGGDTGLIHQGRLPFSETEEAAFSRKVGDVSDPIRTLQGYVVFKIGEKRPSKQLAYGEVDKALLRREMKSSATDKRLAEWITGLKAKADIKFY